MPHFMASYRIVYRDREMIMRHKWASLYVPALLLAYMGLAMASTENTRVMVVILVTVASAYLAWHYTGQVWGMMASYTYLSGARYEKVERVPFGVGQRESEQLRDRRAEVVEREAGDLAIVRADRPLDPQLAPDPLAFGYPTKGDPVLIDISTSTTANAWVRRWMAEGKVDLGPEPVPLAKLTEMPIITFPKTTRPWFIIC